MLIKPYKKTKLKHQPNVSNHMLLRPVHIFVHGFNVP